MIKKICVCGAGTMGSGIAQTCAQSGYDVVLFDLNKEVLLKAQSGIQGNLSMLEGKGKITKEQAAGINNHIKFTEDIELCEGDLIIEAIVEIASVKAVLFNKLAEVNTGDCIFVSNTSSLSISGLQNDFKYPGQMAGLHFFNPATIMKLVEVVKGSQTSEDTIKQLLDFCGKLNKTSVQCDDAPGFIVNRVARHYYLESMRAAEKGAASIEDIDKILEGTGFKLGPFKLMDLIGIDINLKVTEQLYEDFDQAERFKPSILQTTLVEKGLLGKKTGAGFFEYSK